MKRLKTKEELKEYLSQNSLSEILVANLRQDIKLVEECNNNGASPSCLLVAESKQEYEQISKEFNLHNNLPELKEVILIEGELWERQVYVLGDAGNGVVVYVNLANGGNK